jgi:metal-sulfur cluster biosynthetic enzyme
VGVRVGDAVVLRCRAGAAAQVPGDQQGRAVSVLHPDHPGVSHVDVELVWDPPRDPSRMSEAARLQPEMLAPGDGESFDGPKGEHVTMKVWIDQDLCRADGVCAEIAPDVFTLNFADAKGNPRVLRGWPTSPTGSSMRSSSPPRNARRVHLHRGVGTSPALGRDRRTLSHAHDRLTRVRSESSIGAVTRTCRVARGEESDTVSGVREDSCAVDASPAAAGPITRRVHQRVRVSGTHRIRSGCGRPPAIDCRSSRPAAK